LKQREVGGKDEVRQRTFGSNGKRIRRIEALGSFRKIDEIEKKMARPSGNPDCFKRGTGDKLHVT